jgi:hypothetical protein
METALNAPQEKPNLLARIKMLALFRRNRPATSAWNVIAWWESRRIAYNLIVGSAGVVTCVLVGTLVFTSQLLQRALASYGSPGFEVLFVLIYGIAANIFYTFGWIAELVVRRLWPGEAERFATTTFALGLALSVLLTIAPGVISVAIAIVLGIARLAGAYHPIRPIG